MRDETAVRRRAERRDDGLAALRELDLILMRHCQKTGSGLCDALTETGRADAERVADRLMGEGVDAIFCSPYRRAQETVAPFAARTGLPVTIDSRLAEWMISPTALAEIMEHAPAVLADPDYRAPWSETAAECWARIAAALVDIRATGARRPLLSCHGGVLGIALMHLTDTFRNTDWSTFHQPTIVAVHRGAWRRLELDPA